MPEQYAGGGEVQRSAVMPLNDIDRAPCLVAAIIREASTGGVRSAILAEHPDGLRTEERTHQAGEMVVTTVDFGHCATCRVAALLTGPDDSMRRIAPIDGYPYLEACLPSVRLAVANCYQGPVQVGGIEV